MGVIMESLALPQIHHINTTALKQTFCTLLDIHDI